MNSLLRLLGGVSLQRGGTPVGGRAGQRHRLALLALIGIAPAGVSRDRLMALLWPDAEPDRARHLLSHSLYVLRRALGEDALLVSGDTVRLNPVSVACDVWTFERTLQEGDHSRAVALYTGAFLDGFALAGGVEFERWADTERDRLGREYAAALEALAFEREAAGNHGHALEWWRRLAAHDPYNSRTAMHVVRMLEAAGDVAGAFRHARVHEALLREELDVGLPEEMVEEIERLRREYVGRSTDDAVPPDRALEQTPAHRYATAAEVADALRAAETAGRAAGAVRRWRSPVAVAAGAGAVAALVGAAWWLATSSPPAGPPTFTRLTDQPGPELYPTLSPDGASLAYAGRSSGNWDVYLLRVGGKNPINLTEDSRADDTQPAFSPDGQRIAFRSERGGGGIFVMGATGESVKRLTDRGYNPAWSPDGKEVAYATSRFVRPDIRWDVASQLVAVNVTTGATRVLTPTGQDAVQPHWSPRGHRIAYWGNRGAVRDIWTIRADGSEPVAVTDDAHLDWDPVWSADGRFLYFSSDRGGSMNLWRIAIDERSGNVLGRPEPVTTPSPYSGYIAVPRHGARIAYVQQVRTVNLAHIGFDPARGTVVGEPVLITQGLRDVMGPRVSPDGRWVSFFTLGKQEDLFVMRIDGTGLRQLTEDTYRDRGARWSPDGTRIGFFSTRSGRYEIWSINVDGSDPQQLTDFGCNLGPIWSPDGTRFVCNKFPGVTPLVVTLRNSTKYGAVQPLVPWGENGEAFRPWDWSPDGRSLAGHVGTPAGPSGIVVYSFESRQYQQLTEIGQNPRWLSDSRRLLFHHEGQIYLVDSHTKKVRHVLSVGAHDVEDFFSSSADDHLLVFGIVVTEADVWMMESR